MSANKVIAVTLVARVSAYMAQMRAAALNTAAFGTSAAVAGANAAAMAPGMSKAARGLNQAAAGAGLMQAKFLGPAGVLMALKSVGTAAIRFEDEFAMVRKTMQESDAVLDAVALSVRDLALGLPVTTTELNQIATVAGQLGIAAADVEGFTETIAQLSMATNLTAEGAAIDFARLSNVMGKPISEVAELGNVVVHLGNNMAAQETEIMEFAKRIAGVGTSMGMTEGDVLALSAALPALGLRAEMGGTAITRIMVEIQAAVTEGTEKLGIFAEVAGSSADQFAADWKDDPAAALMKFTEGIGTLSDAGVDAFETVSDLDLSMIRTQDTLLRLAGGTDVYRTAQRLQNEETARQEALQIEVAKRMNTTASRAKVLGNNFKEMGLQLGAGMKPQIDLAIQGLNDLFNFTPETSNAGGSGFVRWFFGQNPEFLGDQVGSVDWSNWFTGDARESRNAEQEARETAEREELARQRIQAQRIAEAALGGSLSGGQGVGSGFSAAGTAADRFATSLHKATEAMNEHITAANRASDPMFNLKSALEDVEVAQAEFNTATKEFGEGSPEAVTAAFDLMEAINGAEAAAFDADLSWKGFNDRLDYMVRNGLLDETAANLMRDALVELRTAAELLQGDYSVIINATGNAWERIGRLRQLAPNLPAFDNVVEAMIGARAAGGPVTAGHTYLVGEQGPELWTAQRSGTIIPADQTSKMMSGGSGTTMTVTQNIYGQSDPVTEFRSRDNLRSLARQGAY